MMKHCDAFYIENVSLPNRNPYVKNDVKMIYVDLSLGSVPSQAAITKIPQFLVSTAAT